MDVRNLLRLRAEEGRSDRSVAKILDISKNTVRAYYQAFLQSNLPLAEVLQLNDGDLEELFYRGPEEPERLTVLKEEIPLMEKDLGKRGVDMNCLWQEYLERHPDGYAYTQFCTYLKEGLRKIESSVYLDHKAGDKLFVDFAGGKLPLKDPSTQEEWKAEVLVAVLPYSQFVYVEALKSQKTAHFLNGLANALEYMGGAPALIMPDNMKCAVTRAHRYEPVLNHIFKEFCHHYGTVAHPTRTAAPQDKAHVENMVKIVYKKVYALLRKETFFDLHTLNQRIRELVDKLNNKPLTNRKESRRQLFERDERELLRPLPTDRYEPKRRETKKVSKFCYIQTSDDHSFYSVPFIYVGKIVEVAYSEEHLEVYYNHKRIAYHVRTGKRQNLISAHLPPEHQPGVLEWNEDEVLAKGAAIGPETAAYLKAVIDKSRHPHIANRLCHGILALGKESNYGPVLLNDACKQGLGFKRYSYRSIEDILKAELYKLALNPVDYTLPEHHNLRNDYH